MRAAARLAMMAVLMLVPAACGSAAAVDPGDALPPETLDWSELAPRDSERSDFGRSEELALSDSEGSDSGRSEELALSDSEGSDPCAAVLCGDAVCDAQCGETGAACPQDCCVCGDGWCDDTCAEDAGSCAKDCCICGDDKCVHDCGEDVPGDSLCELDCCVCGDGLCEEFYCGETKSTCPSDCASCGNGFCEAGEGPEECPADCCGYCGDGNCMGTACGETEESCVEDCVDAVCGDGKCEGPETPAGCPKDCAVTVCGNGVCEAGENAQDCPADCTTVCGNCVCEVGENGTSCPPDCGYCGDGVCSNCPGKNEDPGTCPADCCIPACTGIQCGDDGCGGVCGMCAETQECSFGLCLDVGDECQDGNMVPWDGCSAGKITEFRVNTVTMSDQRGPDVAVMTDGSFVVTWASDGQDGNGWGVFGQRFAADGKKASVEFELNAYENGNQGTADCPPRVAALPDGGFVAAWPGQFKDGSGMGIFFQRWGPEGGKAGAESQANTSTAGDQTCPALAVLPDGTIALAWSSQAQAAAEWAVVMRLFDIDGEPWTDEMVVSSGAGANRNPTLASLTSNLVAVAWESTTADGQAEGISAVVASAVGEVLASELQVNVFTAGSQRRPAAAGRLAEDGFVLAWSSDGQDGDGDGIVAALANPSALSPAAELLVNLETVAAQSAPAAAAAFDRFVIAWTSNGQDGSGWGVYLRRYAADGAPSEQEVQANAYTPGHQRSPRAALFPDGRFVAVWESCPLPVGLPGQDGDKCGIFAQRFEKDGTKIYH